jgi:hypothetical protein
MLPVMSRWPATRFVYPDEFDERQSDVWAVGLIVHLVVSAMAVDPTRATPSLPDIGFAIYLSSLKVSGFNP